jgi:hypothetical protein
MKYLFLASALFFLVLAPSTAVADCAFSVSCSLDGEMMMQEQCYYNGLHKTCKFSHKPWHDGKQEYHYVLVACD